MVLKMSGQRACWSSACTVCWKCDKGNSLQSWQSCPLDASGVSRYSPFHSWTLSDRSCTFLSFPFPLGSSVPGFQAQLMTQIGLLGGEVGCPCQEFGTQGGHLHRGNLRIPGGSLGEGGAGCFCVMIATWWSPAWHCPLQRPPCHPDYAGKEWGGAHGSRSCWLYPELSCCAPSCMWSDFTLAVKCRITVPASGNRESKLAPKHSPFPDKYGKCCHVPSFSGDLFQCWSPWLFGVLVQMSLHFCRWLRWNFFCPHMWWWMRVFKKTTNRKARNHWLPQCHMGLVAILAQGLRYWSVKVTRFVPAFAIKWNVAGCYFTCCCSQSHLSGLSSFRLWHFILFFYFFLIKKRILCVRK